jgi:hypothetical protein
LVFAGKRGNLKGPSGQTAHLPGASPAGFELRQDVAGV